MSALFARRTAMADDFCLLKKYLGRFTATERPG